MHLAEIVIAQQGSPCTGLAQAFPGNAQENTAYIAPISQSLRTFLCGTHHKLQMLVQMTCERLMNMTEQIDE